jgi:DNA-binding transcriptional regulator PaaX
MSFDHLSITRPKVWNRHWWVVLADIPSKDFRVQADMFRKKLKNMEFYPLQRTVWIHPFDPRDEIDFVSVHYGIERFVTVLEATTLHADDRERLEKYFKGLNKI